MKSLKLMVLLLSVSAADLYKTTHAEVVAVDSNNVTSVNDNKENKTIIELNKDITVNTGLNLDKTLAQLNGTEASNIPRVRKVTNVDNDSLERKSKTENKMDNNATEGVSVSTTTVNPLQITKILTEAGVVEMPAKNVTNMMAKEVVKKVENKKTSLPPPSSTQSSLKANTTDATVPNYKNITEVATKHDTNIKTNTGTNKPLSITTTTATPPVATNSTENHISSTVATLTYSNAASKSLSVNSTTPSSTTTTTTTTITTTTTTTTTTPKPKKPTVTYSIPDFPDLEKDNPELKNLLQSSSASNKLPLSDGPYAQPSQEFNNNFHRGRDFILPIVSMIFIIPLVIGILITSYRRFRDCWSTRHYRRMDFLVDGMYND